MSTQQPPAPKSLRPSQAPKSIGQETELFRRAVEILRPGPKSFSQMRKEYSIDGKLCASLARQHPDVFCVTQGSRNNRLVCFLGMTNRAETPIPEPTSPPQPVSAVPSISTADAEQDEPQIKANSPNFEAEEVLLEIDYQFV